MKKISGLLLAGCFACITGVYGWQKDIIFPHITSVQGLSQNHVYAIVKDHKGFMWFGTQEGLNKYDDYKMVVYKNIHGAVCKTAANNETIGR